MLAILTLICSQLAYSRLDEKTEDYRIKEKKCRDKETKISSTPEIDGDCHKLLMTKIWGQKVEQSLADTRNAYTLYVWAIYYAYKLPPK